MSLSPYDSDAVPATTEEAKPPVSLDRARRYFLEATSASQANDELCKRDAKYFHGDQLSAEVRGKLKDRGQPPVIVNRIAPAINGVLGIVDAAESDPECFPRSQEDQNAADVGTKLLRYLADQADLPRVKRMVSEDFFVHGTAAAIVGEGAHTGAKNISVTPIVWEDLFFDPLSRSTDFADASYMGIAKWMDADLVRTMYPETYDKLGNPYDSAGDWFDGKHDIEDQRIWVDAQRRRIRVIELYLIDDTGTWQRVCFCQAGLLEHGESVYKDDTGRSICPIVAVSFEINRQSGERYGAIRNAIPLQDEINSRRSKLLLETNNRRVRQTEEGIDPKNKDIAKREAAKADGAIPYGYDMVQASDVFQGNHLLLQQTERDFDRLFPTPAVLSRFGSGDSGRARQIMQQAGYTEWSRAMARLEAFEMSIYRRLWFAAKQFITAETTVRITDEARSSEFLKVNVPRIGMQPAPVINPMTGQPQIDPYTGQPVMQMQPAIIGYDNEIAQMDLDIVLETVADTASLEQEVMAEILRYAGSTGTNVLDPSFKMLLMLSPLPDKTKTVERWEAVRKQMQDEVAQAQQQNAQQAAQATQLQTMQVQSKAAKDTAQARKAEAEATKTEQEILGVHQQHQAQADLFQAMQPPSPTPPQF